MGATYYTRNDENRSRYDDWRKQIRSEGFRRSESNPKYFWTASKNNWKRDSSKFGGRSSSRPYRDSSRFRSKSQNREKSAERPKSDLLKKVETMEKYMEKEIGAIKTSNKNIEEMLKKVTINTKANVNQKKMSTKNKFQLNPTQPNRTQLNP